MNPLLQKFERRFRWFKVPRLTEAIIVMQVAAFLFISQNPEYGSRMVLNSAMMLQGEWWRMLSFVAIPPAMSLLFAFFAWYLFWLMGKALEEFWGEQNYTLFLAIGWALTVTVSFIFPFSVFNNYYFLSSVFLAFAFLNPDFELRLFLILPIKIKWLALFTWATFFVSFVMNPLSVKCSILAAVANFAIFFADDFFMMLKNKARTANWKAKQYQGGDYRHKCAECGKTDIDDPLEDFRYVKVGDETKCLCSTDRERLSAKGS